nr:pre-mRNA splicing Prp18-interacting factor [Tanacetum cinerariifolium]
MSTFVLCVGCGEPLYGFSPCRWCTCERCGIDMINRICPLCRLSNSCANDHNSNSFDCPPDSYHPPHPTYETYSGDTYGNDSQFGYDCPPQFPLNYEPEPGYIQNYNSHPHDSPSFPQQFPCCEDYGVTHEPCQCQPKNHDYYRKQNFCYDSNSIGFDQSQAQQYTVTHPIFSAHHNLLGSQKELNMTLTKVNEQMTQLTSMCELACQIVQKNLEEKQLEEEQAVKAQSWKFPNSFDCPPDSYHPPHPTYKTYSGDTCGNDSQFGYDCPPQFPLNYEPEPGHIQNYNSYPHDSPSFPQQYPCCEDCGFTHEPYQCQPINHDYYHGQNSCYDSTSIGFDQSQPQQYTVNYPIFNAHNDPLISQTTIVEQMTQLKPMVEMFCQFVLKKREEKRIKEEQVAKAQTWKLPVCYDDDDDEEGYNSLNNNIISELPPYSAVTPTEPIDSLKYMLNHDSSIIISSKIGSLFDEFAGELTLLKSFLPEIDETDCHPEKEILFAKRLFDSHMEEINLSFNPDDPMPPGIEEDDDDSERDISILEELLDNYSLSLPANESYHFDIPSPYRPPAKLPDGNTGTLNIKMMGDVSDQKPSAECPMIIIGKNTPVLDVPLFHFYPLDQLK